MKGNKIKNVKIKKSLLLAFCLLLIVTLTKYCRTNALNEEVVKRGREDSEEAVADEIDSDVNILTYDDGIQLYSVTGEKLDEKSFEKMLLDVRNNEVELINRDVEETKENLSEALTKLNNCLSKKDEFSTKSGELKEEVDSLYAKLIDEENKAQAKINKLPKYEDNLNINIIDSNDEYLIFIVEDLLVVSSVKNDQIEIDSRKNDIISSFEDVRYGKDIIVGKLGDRDLAIINKESNVVKEIKTTDDIDKYIVLNNKIVYSTASNINILNADNEELKTFEFNNSTKDFIKDENYVYAINSYGQSFGNNIIAKIDVDKNEIVEIVESSSLVNGFLMAKDDLILEEGNLLRVVDCERLENKSIIRKSNEESTVYMANNGIFELNNGLTYIDLVSKEETELDIDVKNNYKIIFK